MTFVVPLFLLTGSNFGLIGVDELYTGFGIVCEKGAKKKREKNLSLTRIHKNTKSEEKKRVIKAIKIKAAEYLKNDFQIVAKKNIRTLFAFLRCVCNANIDEKITTNEKRIDKM